jgi:hypothetical protein
MAVMPCPTCHKPMSAAAIVCPHCNARRADVTPGVAGKELSPAEIRALVLTNAMIAPAPSQGLLPTLILPHPSTTGTARAVELALTLICLPLVATGALSLAVARGRTRRNAETMRGELAPVLAMLGLGGLGFSSLLSFAGVGFAANLAVTGLSMIALIVRGVIRAQAASERDRELQRLE